MDQSHDQPANASPNGATAADLSDAPGLRPGSLRGDVIQFARGFCMGAADIVPGVSGGTVALILGHYRRLVTAISHFDGTCLSLVLKRDFNAAAQRIDLRFLVALAAGILCGVALLAGTMHWLLDAHLPETLAVFLGLMLASVWIVKDYVEIWSVTQVIAALIGAVVAVGITLLPTTTAELSLPFLFLSASLAICAMILPGISGAFVLLLLGVYHPITGLIKEAARGNVTTEALVQILVFASGCAAGLLVFTRGLRWMLEHHQAGTMAALIGLMLGSLGKLWPLQMPTADTAELEAKFRVMQYVTPGEYPGSLVWLVVLVILAAAAVLLMESAAKRL